ncbi:MAG: LytTR family transcriptional regulator [Lachnospiraceae bacterium]|nr:LytTR family transcriptional regulator [Ruminococcus sp.]MCM1275616.1 LytTR family transcriptional regulator [Lachnospiraceae bacterium]
MFHCANGKTASSKGTLSAYEKAGEFSGFLRVHNSYLVNCAYVYSIETNYIVTDDKTQISRRARKNGA